MLNRILNVLNIIPYDVASSKLYSDKNFYPTFIKDLTNSKESVTIESPFLVKRRLKILAPILSGLTSAGIEVNVATRHPSEYDLSSCTQIIECINFLKALGVRVMLRKGQFHRKVAIIDGKILWEGSLNILSQNNSVEIMRRTRSEESVKCMKVFIKTH